MNLLFVLTRTEANRYGLSECKPNPEAVMRVFHLVVSILFLTARPERSVEIKMGVAPW